MKGLEELTSTLHRLNERYLQDQFGEEEYLKLKNPLIEKQADLRREIDEIDENADGILEPGEFFVGEAIQGFFASQGRNLAAQCKFLKKASSNRQILDKKLQLLSLNAYKTVAL